MVYGIPPFPHVKRSIFKPPQPGGGHHSGFPPLPGGPLQQGWEENGLLPYVSMMRFPQDEGREKECISRVKDHYAPDCVLMIRGCPRDMRAAHDNGVLFYPHQARG